MPTISRILLSGSTSGRPIPVAATATPGTLIHTAVAGASAWDEIWLWVANVTGSAATLTLEYGGVSDPGDHACKALSIAANTGPALVIPGLALNGGLALRAFSGTGSALNLIGYVNRIA